MDQVVGKNGRFGNRGAFAPFEDWILGFGHPATYPVGVAVSGVEAKLPMICGGEMFAVKKRKIGNLTASWPIGRI